MPTPVDDNVFQTHAGRDDEGRRRGARKRGKQTGLPTRNRTTTETSESKDGERQRPRKRGDTIAEETRKVAETTTSRDATPKMRLSAQKISMLFVP